MRILSVRLQCVGVHDDRTFALPDKGAVVVTGRNGAGKSSFVEGVALGLWGESLRGEPLWRDGEQGIVTVEVEVGQTKLVVLRKRNKAGAKSLSWWWTGEEPTKYETPTKAQEALEALVGTFDTWRRTCVLSSADSAHFSLATDAERKRLLERLLGIDRLDAAADAARTDLRKLEQQLALAQQDSRNAASHLATAGARVREVTDSLAALNSTSSGAGTLDVPATQRALKVAQDEYADLRMEQDELRTTLAQAKAQAEEAKRRHERCAAANCPTCEQPIPADLKARLEQESQATVREVERASAKVKARNATIMAALDELNEECGKLRDGLTRAAERERASSRTAKLKETLDAQLADAQSSLAKASEAAAQSAGKNEQLAAAVSVQKAVSEVFGMKGARAHLLDAALRQVERVANRHLTTLGHGMKATLASTTEKKSGGVSEAISLRVSVNGGSPRAYGSLSGGERRRVDVAVLLALAEVAGAASGRKGETLWMDEVFDALDGDGAAAVGTVVETLSNTRAVVLITHSDSLVRSIRARQRLTL